MPSILEIFSFIFYFPSTLVGPSFEFKYFLRFINLEGEYSQIEWKKCYKSGLEHILQALGLAFLLVTYAKATDPMYCITEEFAQKSLLYKHSYIYASMVITRCRYYVAWKLGGGAIDLCGLSYNIKRSEDGKEIASLDKIDPCNLTVMEFSINPKIRLQYWNRSVHLWLKYYVYLRLINLKLFFKKKGLASFITFTISALWHGFYPSYYLFFFNYFFIEQISTFFEEQYDLFNKIEKMGHVIRFIFLQFIIITLQYFGQAFTILNVVGVFKYYSAFNYIPNVLLFLVYIYVTFIHKKKKRVRSDVKEQ
jgi:lysophospholipid acyltransferase